MSTMQRDLRTREREGWRRLGKSAEGVAEGAGEECADERIDERVEGSSPYAAGVVLRGTRRLVMKETWARCSACAKEEVKVLSMKRSRHAKAVKSGGDK